MNKRRWYIPVGMIVLVALGMVALSRKNQTSYGFLEGRPRSVRLVRQYADDTDYRDFYTFAADFNSVCADIAAELTPQGFKEELEASVPGFQKSFRRADRYVTLVNGERPTEQSTNNRLDHVAAPGCVTVGVFYRESNTTIWMRLKARLFR